MEVNFGGVLGSGDTFRNVTDGGFLFLFCCVFFNGGIFGGGSLAGNTLFFTKIVNFSGEVRRFCGKDISNILGGELACVSTAFLAGLGSAGLGCH